MTSPQSPHEGVTRGGVAPRAENADPKEPRGLKEYLRQPAIIAVVGSVTIGLLTILANVGINAANRAEQRRQRELDSLRYEKAGEIALADKERQRLDQAMRLLASPNEKDINDGIRQLSDLAAEKQLSRTVTASVAAFVKQLVPRPALCPATSSAPASVNVQRAVRLIGSLRSQTAGLKLELDNTDLHQVNLQGVDLRSADLSGACLEGARLDSALLDSANMRGAVLTGASLVGTSLVSAHLERASASHAVFDGAKLDAAVLDSAILDSASFINAMLRDARLTGAQGEGALFVEADLGDADLAEAKLRNAEFRDADLRCARLHNADLDGAGFSDATLPWANFGGASLFGVRDWIEVESFRSAYLSTAEKLTAELRLHARDSGAFVEPLSSVTWKDMRMSSRVCRH